MSRTACLSASYPHELLRCLRGALVRGAGALGAAGAGEAPAAGGGHDAVAVPRAVVGPVHRRHRHAGGARRAGRRRAADRTSWCGTASTLRTVAESDTYGPARKLGISQASTSQKVLIKCSLVFLSPLQFHSPSFDLHLVSLLLSLLS